MGDDAVGDVLAEDSLLLAATDDLADDLDVFDEVVVGELGDETGALADFGLHDNGHGAVDGVAFEMDLGDVLELFAGVVEVFEALDDLLVEAVEVAVDGGAEDFVLAFEVEIDGAVGDTGSGGYGADGSVEVAVFGDNFDCGIEDALIFFVGGVAEDAARDGFLSFGRTF